MSIPYDMWECPMCGEYVFNANTKCPICRYAKEASKTRTRKITEPEKASPTSNIEERSGEKNSDGFVGFWDDLRRETSISTASGKDLPYVVLQVTLKEKFWGTGSGNLSELEEVINQQVRKGYRLHTCTTSNGGSKGFTGGDRIQATLIFEHL